jgi:hypothetical protein
MFSTRTVAPAWVSPKIEPTELCAWDAASEAQTERNGQGAALQRVIELL